MCCSVLQCVAGVLQCVAVRDAVRDAVGDAVGCSMYGIHMNDLI